MLASYVRIRIFALFLSDRFHINIACISNHAKQQTTKYIEMIRFYYPLLMFISMACDEHNQQICQELYI